ncbi:MAG: prephenate dehydratase domain-containing protein, partial [Planctomycetota bacterium]
MPGLVADSVLREIVTHSRRVQESEPHGLRAAAGPRVAFQGAAGAYSERAVRELAARDGKPGVQPIGFPTFDRALDALEAGDVDHALLPVDNSICGRIDAVWDALAARPVFAVDEITSRVDHCLVGLPGAELAQLTRIRSHPVALAQCGRALASLPGATPEPWGDTADAARSVASAQDPTLAALCHEDAGRLHGLVVLRRDMADAEVTHRFVMDSLTTTRPSSGSSSSSRVAPTRSRALPGSRLCASWVAASESSACGQPGTSIRRPDPRGRVRRSGSDRVRSSRAGGLSTLSVPATLDGRLLATQGKRSSEKERLHADGWSETGRRVRSCAGARVIAEVAAARRGPGWAVCPT